MEVKNIKIMNKGGLVGFCTAFIFDIVEIDAAVMKGESGYFVKYASTKSEKDGKYYDKVRFKNKKDREKLDKFVIDAMITQIGINENFQGKSDVIDDVPLTW